VIVAEGLTKFYGDRPAIQDLSFRIGQGEVVGLLGLNGAGKSTALRILSCLLLPTSGRVTIEGEDVVTHGHQIRKRVGYLPETPPLYSEMTVRGYLEFVARLKGMSASDAKGRVTEVAKSMHVDDVAGDQISTLSLGYRQRVGLAQAIVHNPALLILDEPILGLDPVQIVDMRERIKALRGAHTILVSSHILPEISQTVDRILVLHEGRIVAEGTEQDLSKRFAGDHSVIVEVRAGEAELRTAVEKIGGVSVRWLRVGDAQGAGGPYRGEGVLEACLQSDKDNREVVARALVEANLGLRGLRPAEVELESIFVQLTKTKEVAA